jgi:hypothetical protein
MLGQINTQSYYTFQVLIPQHQNQSIEQDSKKEYQLLILQEV